MAKTKEVVAELGLKKDSYTIMQVRAPQPRTLRLRYCRHRAGRVADASLPLPRAPPRRCRLTWRPWTA